MFSHLMLNIPLSSLARTNPLLTVKLVGVRVHACKHAVNVRCVFEAHYIHGLTGEHDQHSGG